MKNEICTFSIKCKLRTVTNWQVCFEPTLESSPGLLWVGVWINGSLLPSPLNFHPHVWEQRWRELIQHLSGWRNPLWQLDECLTHPPLPLPLPHTIPPPLPTATPGPEPSVRLKSNLLRSQQQKSLIKHSARGVEGEALRRDRPPHFSAFDKQHANV